MASAVIHICVAKKINDKLKLNPKLLYLGTIAPDTAKILNQTKDTTHFQEKPHDDYPKLEWFLEKYRKNINDPYVLGYYIHLYTDRLWATDFINKYLFSSFIHLKSGEDISLSKSDMKELLYNDYTNLNVGLIDHYDLELSLFYEDIIYPEVEISEVPNDKLHLVVDKMGVIIKNSTNDKNYVLDHHEVIKFIDYAYDIIYEDIKSLLNIDCEVK